MKNCILILTLFCLSQGHAQTIESDVAGSTTIGHFEGEIGTGLAIGTTKLNFDKINPGATFYA